MWPYIYAFSFLLSEKIENNNSLKSEDLYYNGEQNEKTYNGQLNTID